MVKFCKRDEETIQIFIATHLRLLLVKQPVEQRANTQPQDWMLCKPKADECARNVAGDGWMKLVHAKCHEVGGILLI